MALPLHVLKKLSPLLKGDVLSLGYPDLDVTAAEVESLFGYKPTRFTKAHEWHGRKDPLPETEELFDHLGARLTVVYFTQDRGMEKIADLNHPHDLGKFDLVIDPGTLEHCFNIGQGFLNAANAVRAGGYICHISPMTMLNHGFYNLNPTLFHDFYTQNHWRIDELKVVQRPNGVSSVDRFVIGTEYIIRCVVQRMEEEPLVMPIQTKYLKKMRAK
jgi:hypothetical protein